MTLTLKSTIILAEMALASAILYHLGGMGADGKKAYPWAPAWLFSGKMRDCGCALCAVWSISWYIAHFNPYIAAISFFLHWAALSAYWKKSGDMQFKHWFAHGFFIGLAAVPFIWCGLTWQSMAIRSICLGLSMAIWSSIVSTAWLEECGRGALIILTVSLCG